MKYLSLFSGIEAATAAWEPLGWEAAAYAEIDSFCSALLAHHYPNTPNLGDVTAIKEDAIGPVDLIVGGSPCQSFSVAGKRAGLDDPRGNLTLVYLAHVHRVRPRWVVWENVPGVLSIDGGRTFGAILGTLGQLGYGFAYRVLDAQFYGVPQRRRRVFVVGHLGDWRPAAAVLFERHSLSGTPPPRREAGEGLAGSAALSLRARSNSSHRADSMTFVPDLSPTLRAGQNRTGGDRPPGTDVDTSDTLIPVSYALNSSQQRLDGTVETFVTHSLRPEGYDASEDGTGRGTPIVSIRTAQTSANGHGIAEGVAHTLDESNGQALAFETRSARNGRGRPDSVVPPLKAESGGGDSAPMLLSGMAVRRLTPTECERLQGFKDGYTLIPYRRGKPASDSVRYRALGNSMAVPVMHWIGQRIQMVDDLLKEAQ